MKTMLFGFLLSFLFSSLGLAASSAAPELPTVEQVDLVRYVGKWHEIASIPQKFQAQCVANTTAEYEILPAKDVRVLNSCETADGSRDSSEGRARVVDAATNAKLEVTFVNIGGNYVYLFGGKYWIIYLDENYRYAIVGHPDRTYGWILSRDPAVPADRLTEMKEFLKTSGYDLCKFMITPQTGGLDTKKSLCE